MQINKITLNNNIAFSANKKFIDTNKHENKTNNKKIAIALCGLAVLGSAALYISKAKTGKVQPETCSEMARANMERLRRLSEEETKMRARYDELAKQADALFQKAIELSS